MLSRVFRFYSEKGRREMKAYKGFDKDLKCRDFQYEIGKEYEEKEASLCNKGFHACEYPLDCFGYYAPASSRFCEVELDATDERHNDDTKICGTKIKVGAEIGIPGLVKAAIEYVTEKAEPSGRHHSTAKQKANSTTGDWSANSATGDWSANLSIGNECENNGEGERNICIGWGRNNKCKGAVGCFLVLSEWDEWDGNKYPFIGATMVEVDGETIKADTYYILKNGKIIEAE